MLALLPALLTAAALLAALLLPALAALLVLLIAWIRHQIYSLDELRLTPHSGETFLTTLMPSCRPRPPNGLSRILDAAFVVSEDAGQKFRVCVLRGRTVAATLDWSAAKWPHSGTKLSDGVFYSCEAHLCRHCDCYRPSVRATYFVFAGSIHYHRVGYHRPHIPLLRHLATNYQYRDDDHHFSDGVHYSKHPKS